MHLLHLLQFSAGLMTVRVLAQNLIQKLHRQGIAPDRLLTLASPCIGVAAILKHPQSGHICAE